MIQYVVLMLVRRVPISVLLLAVSLAACAGRGGIPREPFADVPVPASFLPYSDEWVRIRTDRAEVARLVYMSQLDAERAVAVVRELLGQHGWTLLGTDRTLTADGYRMTVLDFAKADDTVRATVREAGHATHVELAVARLLAK